MRVETHPHEAGFGSNRVSPERGEYVPAPCTHRPSKHPSGVRMRLSHDSRIWAPQGGLSRNKVAVGESAAGSPPTDRDLPSFEGRPTKPTHSSRVRTRSPRPTGHQRTTRANTVRHRLSLSNRESGPIAQWESASFARRMPWVRIPVGPCQPDSTRAPSRAP